VVEAKKEVDTLAGVEIQTSRYVRGLPADRPAWRRRLPFVYESTGAETHFTNGLGPELRARNGSSTATCKRRTRSGRSSARSATSGPRSTTRASW
jgi:type I site-specific restriction endonuclease